MAFGIPQVFACLTKTETETTQNINEQHKQQPPNTARTTSPRTTTAERPTIMELRNSNDQLSFLGCYSHLTPDITWLILTHHLTPDKAQPTMAPPLGKLFEAPGEDRGQGRDGKGTPKQWRSQWTVGTSLHPSVGNWSTRGANSWVRTSRVLENRLGKGFLWISMDFCSGGLCECWLCHIVHWWFALVTGRLSRCVVKALAAPKLWSNLSIQSLCLERLRTLPVALWGIEARAVTSHSLASVVFSRFLFEHGKHIFKSHRCMESSTKRRCSASHTNGLTLSYQFIEVSPWAWRHVMLCLFRLCMLWRASCLHSHGSLCLKFVVYL